MALERANTRGHSGTGLTYCTRSVDRLAPCNSRMLGSQTLILGFVTVTFLNTMLNVLRDTSALITVAAMGGSNVMVSIKGLPVEHAMPVEAASPALSFSSQDTIKDYLYYQTFLEQVAHHATRGDSQAAIELAVENLEYVFSFLYHYWLDPN